MKSNNLNKVENTLRSIAKRYKSIKYSLGLAILFLMMGVSAFSEEVVQQEVPTAEQISTSKENLKGSLGNLQSKIETARKENEKSLAGLKLELIQLMEQGDQVVKMPWSSWQYGAGYIYNSWGKAYKGYGDKKEGSETLVRDTSGSLKRFLENSSTSSSSYGSTNLAMVSEPTAEIEVSAGIRPKSINKEAPSYTPVAPAGALPPFEPKLISPPAKPAAPVEVSPVTFSPPDINFKGRGFPQGALIGMPRLQNSENVVIQNYDSYDTVDKNTNAKGIFNIEVGNLAGGVKARWWGSNLDGTANPNVQIKAITNVPNTATPGLTRGGFNTGGAGTFWLGDGNTTFKGMNAFINELRDHDATISGNYVLTNRGGEGVQSNRIFLSHNPAGVGGSPLGPYDGQAQALEKTATFSGTLTLHGTPTAFTGSTAHSDVTIGVEHQLWSRRVGNDWITVGAYSTFNNTGKITLASGNNLVGILMDVEAWNDNLGVPHKTKNNGKIEITNAQNSIGIDYGEYANETFKSELTVGNIIVGGKKNYGLRMANIFSGNAAYFDKGTTIKSGGTDKKILVQGEENVGVSIAKFLSSAKNSNPIAGITEGLNIEVTGQKNIGFLRHKSYANNTGDMVFNATTMGTFTFGNGAKNSTLIRTDKYGIQVRKNISVTGKDNAGKDYTGIGNTVLHSNGETQHINNYNTITVGKGFTQTLGMAATGSANSTIVNILNEGTISLLGKKSIGMYVDKFTQGKSTGTIKLSGVGDKDKSGNVGAAENVGISNKGKFTLSGTLEVNGKKSSGIYNTGETTIAVGTSPTAKTNITVTNGATALYSKGAGTKIESTAGNKLNITVNAGTTKEGLAVYAEDKSQVTLHNANINVNGGSAGVASYNAGTKVDLTGATLKYNGDGYAVYSDGKGEIELKNSNIELRGSSTLMELDWSIAPGSRPIKTSGTNVKVFSNDVVAINVSNLGTRNLSTLSALKSLLGVNITAGTEGGKTFNKYKELAIENGEINFDVATDKAAADTTPGGFFFKKVLGQRLRLNVNQNLTARLSSAIAEEFYNKQVVGLEANSSKQATSNTETQVNIANGKVVDVARTDGTDNGGVGVFINYGLVDNNGTINVEKDSVANSNAVGVYAVNGSEVKNNGTINVSGKDSIGILGVAYRTDSKNKNVVDEFGKSATGQGKVNILNKGNINLDGQGATGIFAKNNKAGATLTNAIATNDTTGKITTTGIKSVGMSGEKANIINRGTINVNGQEGTGMFAKSSSRMENSGTINITASTSASKPNIGMFTEDQNTEIHNNKNIVGGNNTYGIYGKTINMGTNGKIKVGNNSVGIYSNGQYTSSVTPTVNLASGSTIEVGNNQAVGVFTTGKNQNISSQADMKIGDNSYGYVVRGTGTRLTTNSPNPVTVGNDTVFAYSTDRSGTIVNRTTLTSTGSKNYGIYAAGNSTNLGDINFGSGVGNVGMYSISGGRAINGSATINSIIRVSASDKTNKLFGIGMAAGYTDDNGVVHQTGTVENYGTIKVEKDNGIGMYATGRGSKAINRGNIELSGKSTTGMYLDNNAIGENYGTIKTVPNPTNTGIIGVVALNGAVIKNYGTIEIKGNNNTGIYLAKGKREGADPIATDGATDVKEKKQADTSKKVSGIEIKAPGDGTATIKRNGKVVTPTYVDTTVASAKAPKVRVGNTELDLRASGLGNLPSISRASELGMYVDTSGVNYTNPIKGLEKLTGLKKVNLIFGTEAARYTNSKNIQVGTNILKPYNDVVARLSVGGGKKFGMASSSLTWIATGTQNSDDTFKSVYLVKIPYTSFAKDQDTYNFMDGLEKRYGVEGVGTREKELFDKLNGIGKGEPRLLAQAVDEMKGHQYSNLEQRVNATSQILDKEISNLSKEWSNLTKDANKLKTFGLKGEYKSETSGVLDYKNYAYGVVYKNENEDIKLGKGIGWYGGIVHNTFKFKDLGKSKEQMLEGKVGLFKSVPFDDNNSLNWTISGDVFAGYSKMNRKFLVVDEIFNAKANYHIYGIGVKNEIGKSFRLSEDFALRPYVALKAEYGRVSKIREKNGQMKLEVKANDYISIRPEVGTELSYRHYFGVKTLRTSIGVAYENELGKVGSVKNKVRVGNTTADWYNLRGEKEDRRGNVKFDFNVGLDNQIIGVTGNVGYDTKGENVRGGLGLRVIF
ncbi:autotransporter-associated N-terminal domain-containing protein [Fusobacterium nucleatum]|nr:autotransporter-associated N-terminal domain-containing protein [Fusobacterium nucleatum]BEP02527.1 autotransporter-associated N-terminal domain-containing protein [Fusobacterium nucleatum]